MAKISSQDRELSWDHNGSGDRSEISMGYTPLSTVNRQQWEGAMSGGLTRPQGHPLGSWGEYMAMVGAIAMGDMGTVTNYELRKKGVMCPG